MQKEFNYGALNTVLVIVMILVGIYAITAIPTTSELKEITDEAVGNIEMPVMPIVPTAQEVADLIVIPEAPEMPDTFYSVIDEKEAYAEGLAEDEMNDRDFEDDLADFIADECAGTEDIDGRDITSITIRDSDVTGWGQDVTVELELKVYYDNYGDDEESENARVIVYFEVVDLDRNDDYEDGEVDEYNFVDFKSCSTD